MRETDPSPDTVAPRLPLPGAADLQDHLLAASHDLDRLQRLIDDACMALMGPFTAAVQQIDRAAVDHPQAGADLGRARAALAGAVTALQFQDLATQLIAHTRRGLRSHAQHLANGAIGDDDADGPGVAARDARRPNPVTQDEMDAGSIELF
jgi:hypothetical protein